MTGKGDSFEDYYRQHPELKKYLPQGDPLRGENPQAQGTGTIQVSPFWFVVGVIGFILLMFGIWLQL